MPTCNAHRRPYPPPVRSPLQAVQALALATDGGRDPCVVIACLDRGRRPLTIFIVDHLQDAARDLLLTLDVLLDDVDRAAPRVLDAVFLGVSRPDGRAEVGPADRELWAAADRRCREAGILALDLFVVCRDVALSVAREAGFEPAW